MLSWFTTRVFAFPAWVIRSTLFESLVRRCARCAQQFACE